MRPSYSNVASTLTLLIALSSTAYAANRISGFTIRKHTITGIKLKENTLTGKQVDETKLSKVPEASVADSLASPLPQAVQPFRIAMGYGERRVLSISPFTITAQCQDEGGQNFYRVYATTSEPAAAYSEDVFGSKRRDVSFQPDEEFTITEDQEATMNPSILTAQAFFSGPAQTLSISLYQLGHLGSQCSFDGFAIEGGP